MAHFRIASDLHLEGLIKLPPNIILEMLDMRLPKMPNEDQQTLLLPGDIVTLYAITTIRPFSEDISARFKQVVYIPGNHEYWYGSLPQSWTDICYKIKGEWKLKNFSCQVNEGVIYDTDDGVRVLGTALWTDFNGGNPMDMIQAKNSMVDYDVTKSTATNEWLTPKEIYHVHQQQRNWLFAEIENARYEDKRVVVMTHHAPLYQSVQPKWRGQAINTCFYSDLSDEILDTKPAAWIHGHMHDAFQYTFDQTRVICNPRGYGFQPVVDSNYNPYLVIEV